MGFGEQFQDVHHRCEICSPAKMQRITYIETCSGGYHPPAVYVVVTIHSVGVGYSTTLWRVSITGNPVISSVLCNTLSA